MQEKYTDIDDHTVFNINKCFHLEDYRKRHREKFVLALDRHEIPLYKDTFRLNRETKRGNK